MLFRSGIATVVPRHAMALAIAYLLTDLAFGYLPFTVSHLAISYHTRALAGAVVALAR